MIKIILCCGIPASGKSTWAKDQVKNDPDGTIRINRDDLRNMLFNYHFSGSNEKMVLRIRDFCISDGLKRGKNIIIDDTNLKRSNFDDICKMAKALNIECIVMEKPFYIELNEAIERDNKREGTAKVGSNVIKKFWDQSGGKQFKFYKPRVENISKQNGSNYIAMVQDKSLPEAIIVDLDGTMCDISHRSPYDASKCLDDKPNQYVVDLVKLINSIGVKVIFLSGREDKYFDLSKEWLDTYYGKDYDLFMRKSADLRKDSIIKEEIFNSEIKNKYFVKFIIDDRLQVCQMWYRIGLPIFRVGDPDACF